MSITESDEEFLARMKAQKGPPTPAEAERLRALKHRADIDAMKGQDK